MVYIQSVCDVVRSWRKLGTKMRWKNDEFTSGKRKKVTHGHRKIPLALLCVATSH